MADDVYLVEKVETVLGQGLKPFIILDSLKHPNRDNLISSFWKRVYPQTTLVLYKHHVSGCLRGI